MSLKILKG